MGYETKLMVGVKREKFSCDTETYFDIYAEIDLCKCGYSSAINCVRKHAKKKKVFWYGSDGNERVTEDRYGEYPTPVAIKTVIKALKKDCKKDEYRRFKWALALLEEMNKEEIEKLSVLFFGH